LSENDYFYDFLIYTYVFWTFNQFKSNSINH
jgi:hypothetical protein